MSEQHGTKYEQWLDRSRQYTRRTTKGNAVLCLKININKAGHGYLSYMTDEGKVDPENQPVMNVEQATEALRALWEQAVADAAEQQV